MAEIRPIDQPAGPKRADAMARSKDELAEKAENQPQKFSVDVNSIELENEIVGKLNPTSGRLEITNPVPGYRYLFVRDELSAIAEVEQRVARELRADLPGYKRVDSGDPECPELRGADGARRLGDTILFRCPEEVAALLDRVRTRRARARLLPGNLVAQAERLGSRYVHAYEVEGDPHEIFSGRAGRSPREFSREIVQTQAVHQIAEDAKSGNIHGLPLDKVIKGA